MKISILTPISFTGLGKRDNNEDCIYPFLQQATANDQLFVVCDGVGGQDKGEVASELACKSFANFFNINKQEAITEDLMKSSFSYTENAFDEYFVENAQAKGMATTVVMAYLHEKGISVGYCGDSRLYQIRNKEIIFQTQDHTPTNDLLRAGVITQEEAQENKRTSKISRAIQGKTVRAVLPEIHLITDIQAGDIFFLCSDGVWDTLEDNFLKLFQSNSSNEEVVKMIVDYCAEDSKDNFSAYLIPIEKVFFENIPLKQENTKLKNQTTPHQNNEITSQETLKNITPQQNQTTQNLAQKSIFFQKGIVAVTILTFFIIVFAIYYNNQKKPTQNNPKNTGNPVASEIKKNNTQNQEKNKFDDEKGNKQNTQHKQEGKNEKTIIREFYEKTTNESVSVSLLTGNLYRITKSNESISSLCLYNGKKPQNVGVPYQSEWRFSNGLCKVSTNDIPKKQKHGFINTTGTAIGEGIVYESIKFENDKIHAVKNGEDIYMDYTGKEIKTTKKDKPDKKITENPEEKPENPEK